MRSLNWPVAISSLYKTILYYFLVLPLEWPLQNAEVLQMKNTSQKCSGPLQAHHHYCHQFPFPRFYREWFIFKPLLPATNALFGIFFSKHFTIISVITTTLSVLYRPWRPARRRSSSSFFDCCFFGFNLIVVLGWVGRWVVVLSEQDIWKRKPLRNLLLLLCFFRWGISFSFSF